jgi:hypothetical protein
MKRGPAIFDDTGADTDATKLPTEIGQMLPAMVLAAGELGAYRFQAFFAPAKAEVRDTVTTVM